MSYEAEEYWIVRRDYGGTPFIRLDRAHLVEDYGFEVSNALLAFLEAHYKFNDPDNPPSERERENLVSVMVQARDVLGEINPYLFVDSLTALEQKIGS